MVSVSLFGIIEPLLLVWDCFVILPKFMSRLVSVTPSGNCKTPPSSLSFLNDEKFSCLILPFSSYLLLLALDVCWTIPNLPKFMLLSSIKLNSYSLSYGDLRIELSKTYMLLFLSPVLISENWFGASARSWLISYSVFSRKC